jgi:hypothetical protein
MDDRATFSIARIGGLVGKLDIIKRDLFVVDVGESNRQEQLKQKSDYQHIGWEVRGRVSVRFGLL